MEIRKITKEELKTARELSYIAFDNNIDGKNSVEEALDQILNHPCSRLEQKPLEKWGYFEDDGTLASSISCGVYPVRFGKEQVSMCGIADVCTLPHCQGKGYASKLFYAMLREQFDNGCELSYLYPFSTGYYRRFGYETGADNMICWELRTDWLPRYGQGSCRPVPLAYSEELDAVYTGFMKGVNLSVIREEPDWKAILRQYKGAKVYLYRNAEGEPKGYLFYYKQQENGLNYMSCPEFFYADPEGLKGLLAFVQSRSADFDYLRMNLPAYVRIDCLLPEVAMKSRRPGLSPYKASYHCSGMVRVVNVEQILKKAVYKGSGIVRLRTEDPILPENTAVWEVWYSDGGAQQVIREDSSEEYDVSVTIPAFSALMSGGAPAEQLTLMRGVELCCEPEKLEGIFYPKRAFIADHF